MANKLTLEQVRTKSANRIAGLSDVQRKAAELLIDFAYACGVPIVITQGLRTIDEQNGLYAQGRTKPGQIVTNARGGYSYHNFGVAIDFALLLPDGKNVSWDMRRDGDGDGIADWDEVVAEAKRIGWNWGGDWRSFKDYPHFEMTFGLATADYRAGKRPSQTQLNASMAKIDTLKSSKTEEDDDEMTTEEKDAFRALQDRVVALESTNKLAKVPAWAEQACVNAKAAGVLDTANDGSYDFYRMITVLDRAGVFGAKGGAA
ncbi:peptidoglycan L-alanyl-D-glutamate endopeptidase CwlK [Paenibacillus jamilae]|jgi:peptidoglycan L-alanyl-D-glutamate endopeptidase CwlK|uniref:M15 family metallopeptidase n=1 Tax=Paenibacillus polymyxa TaxID=1406 RepID=UPI001580C7A4|nr:M15 family metallopeptidase [Paenibacillus polymyxa]MDP9674902.1 peptidoglycan L-alanyl-D-glutamate endopeptidase CwlK [Paenibacillus jamilae]MBY0023737.1 M15 family metallopeptidase [Paenibacillus polymyxa]MBY0056409.1 M15 family metallopeptidase [Paenibacillus polymyxa]MBY0071756.1 M15 family metallopeptidase [Paenibacillus polymyxa]MBY0080678.1 M15 family metallopeptidase [Paenibacillus polymyxa]